MRPRLEYPPIRQVTSHSKAALLRQKKHTQITTTRVALRSFLNVLRPHQRTWALPEGKWLHHHLHQGKLEKPVKTMNWTSSKCGEKAWKQKRLHQLWLWMQLRSALKFLLVDTVVETMGKHCLWYYVLLVSKSFLFLLVRHLLLLVTSVALVPSSKLCLPSLRLICPAQGCSPQIEGISSRHELHSRWSSWTTG